MVASFFFYPYGTNRNIKIFIGSDDPDTRREFSELCGQKKVKNFSVNTSAESPASSNTGASNQPLITIGMLERLNGDEKGDAIVSVRGYEPIWSRFTPSFELKDVYFAEGKADISKREARLFDKDKYVFDILGGSQAEEEEKQLDAIERREQEQAEEETEKVPDIAALDKAWNAKVEEVHTKVLKVAEMLAEEDAEALLQAKLEHKQILIALLLEQYTDMSTQQKLKTLDQYLSEELPKLLELQEKAKNKERRECLSKFFKMLPILAVGLIAALATVGCASTENQEPTETAVQRTAAVTYAAIDGSCEHDYEATQTFAATCTEQGYTVYTCANCGDSYTDNFVAAKGHTFQDIIVPATCTHKGYVTHFCTTCGYEYSDTFVDETGHDYTDEVTAPTCTEQGYTTHTCNTCGYSYKDSYVEALGHDYTEVVTEPTCTDGGYTTYTCQTCGNEAVADYTEAKGHTYSETVHPATCVSYGYTENLCNECGDRYVTDYQKATGHTYLDIVVEATEDSIGYTRHLCVVCNYSYLSDFVTSGDDGYIEGEEPAHEHEYKLYVQDFETDKYFIALRVCVCGDSKVGNLNIQLSNADGKTLQLVANEYGQVDYADVYGDWLVTILDEDGAELSVFDLSAGEAPEEPTEPENPDEGEEPGEPENPDDGNGEPENPDDGESETPENPDDGNGGETPEEPEQPADETGGGSTAVILLIVFVLLVAGGIGAVIFLKKRKNKNQN